MASSTNGLTINATGKPAVLSVLLHFPDCDGVGGDACERAAQATATMISMKWRCPVSICREGIDRSWCIPMNNRIVANIDTASSYMRDWLFGQGARTANPLFDVELATFHSGKAAKYFIEHRLPAIRRIHKTD